MGKQSIYKPILAIGLSFCVLLSYQNCVLNEMFGEAYHLELPSVESNDLDKWNHGFKVWNNQCSSCHGDISSTKFRGVNDKQILNAIRIVGVMNSISLTSEELVNLVFALNNDKPDTSTGGDTRHGAKFQCSDSTTRGLSRVDMLRLSDEEIKNSLTDLFGTTHYKNASEKIVLLPADDLVNPKAYVPTLSYAYFDVLVQIVEKIAETAASDSSFISKWSSCSSLATESCVKEFIENFGARAIRKPFPVDDKNNMISAFNSDPEVNGKVIIMSIILHPEFSLHYENGSTSGERERLDDYGVASRISYRVIGSIPDNELWKAAKDGQLKDLEQVKYHVTRMIDSSRGKAKAVSFFKSWMKIEDMADLSFSNNFRNGIQPSNYYSHSVTEFENFVLQTIWNKNGSLNDLFLSQNVYPVHTDMATLFGTDKWTGSNELKSQSGHRGILLRPATLIGGTNFTPIIRRGVMLRTEVLCDKLGLPSPDVVNARDEVATPEELDHSFLSDREVVANMTRNAACMECHTQINPLGFGLLTFDSLGRLQATETFFDPATDEVVAQYPVDASTDVAKIEIGANESYNNAFEMNQEILKSDKLKACFAEKMTIFMNKQDVTKDDECTMADKESIIRNPDSSVRDILIENVANEDIFWRK